MINVEDDIEKIMLTKDIFSLADQTKDQLGFISKRKDFFPMAENQYANLVDGTKLKKSLSFIT